MFDQKRGNVQHQIARHACSGHWQADTTKTGVVDSVDECQEHQEELQMIELAIPGFALVAVGDIKAFYERIVRTLALGSICDLWFFPQLSLR